MSSYASSSASVRAGREADPPPRKWTVMVFMGADTIGSNFPLQDAARADIAEMAAVGEGAKPSTTLDMFVQVHGLREQPQRARIVDGHAPLANVPADEQGIEGGHALECFIRAALRESGYQPNTGHQTLLVLWGHAYEFAIGRVKRRNGTIDPLDFAELFDVLARFQRPDASPEKLDILGFDACDLATVEMACQLQPFARYMVGSQIGIPIPGWPYDRILHRLHAPLDRLMGPAELGSYIVRRFCESYPAASPVSLTLLDLDRAAELFAHAEVLADHLAQAAGEPGALARLARLFTRSQTDLGRPYVDVADLCLSLWRESGDALVAEAARALGDFLLGPRPPLAGDSIAGAGRPFIAEHGRNAGHAARLNGLSIYAPHVAPQLDFEFARPQYHNFQFAQQTRWSELVHAFARLT